jgi:micrococcal nuclease
MARKKYKPFIFQNFTIIRAVDGDTTEIEVDYGFKGRYRDNFRLTGIDTPERGQDGFTEATERLIALVEQYSDDLVLEVTKRDKYGRYLARIRVGEVRIVDTEISINEQMVNEGHAKPYDGGKR